MFCNKKNQTGFTLIELLITVAIVAILGAIAFPMYTDFVERGRRNDAKAVMLEAAQFMERRFTENRSYVGATLPTSLTQAPREGDAWYAISVNIASATAYTVTAAPKSGWTPKKCGSLTLNELGSRAVSTSDSLADCWNK